MGRSVPTLFQPGPPFQRVAGPRLGDLFESLFQFGILVLRGFGFLSSLHMACGPGAQVTGARGYPTNHLVGLVGC